MKVFPDKHTLQTGLTHINEPALFTTYEKVILSIVFPAHLQNIHTHLQYSYLVAP